MATKEMNYITYRTLKTWKVGSATNTLSIGAWDIDGVLGDTKLYLSNGRRSFALADSTEQAQLIIQALAAIPLDNLDFEVSKKIHDEEERRIINDVSKVDFSKLSPAQLAKLAEIMTGLK